MQYQLKRIRCEQLRCDALLIFLIILLFLNNEYKWGIGAVGSVLISVISALLMFLQKRDADTVDKINSVKPIWKFLSVDSKVEYFSLDKDKSVLDNVKYYSLIFDNDKNIRSVNKLDDGTTSVKEQNQLTSNGELIKFYFSENAVVESEKAYQLNESPLLNSSNTKTAKPIFLSNSDCGSMKLNIIEATTIYGDHTYFFESENLSGGLTKIDDENYKPYSGDWDSDFNGKCKLDIAKCYLSKLDKYVGEKEKQTSNVKTTCDTTSQHG